MNLCHLSFQAILFFLDLLIVVDDGLLLAAADCDKLS